MTLFEVLLPVCKKQKRQLPDADQRLLLGKICAQHYHDLKIKHAVRRIKRTEFGKEYTVLSYPKIFKPEMVKKINDFLVQNSVPFSVSGKPKSNPIKNRA